MKIYSMIVVTGAAGFIGSILVAKLNSLGYENLILVDDFSKINKEKNLARRKYIKKVERDEFFSWFDDYFFNVDFVFHIGARTDTAEFNHKIFDELNVKYSKNIFKRCAEHGIPLVYASSAATYGMGEFGFVDDHSIVSKLKPLNPYGESKNNFDKWVLKEKQTPPFWAGLKFFNVYGPNESHKGRMASVIFHAYHQILKTGKMKLFKSHHPDYKDGEQLRDFVYVKDLVKVIMFLFQTQPASGLYNLGTGKARSFRDLVLATFAAMDKEPVIEFIDTPVDIRDKYQYFTEADMHKLLKAGYQIPFTSLEEGVEDYVKKHLKKAEL
ncbi:MAG: ADP-glyceromanno-heptose 6-epimerase [Bacteroidales bacterium]|nr:ADP-glyceromanno-heptose 6-epimerase [Bacteroidales bacterium]